VITAHAGLMGVSHSVLELIFNCNTTEEMIRVLREEGLLMDVFNSISTAIRDRVFDVYMVRVDVFIMDMDGTLLNSNHQVVLG
jgi:cobalamin biosynthesis protein CbiD